MQYSSLIRGVAAAALFVAATASPSNASAESRWDWDQELDIRSSAHNQVIYYDYLTGVVSSTDVAYGDREVRNFIIREDNWVGAFLYDYAEARYTTALWTYMDRY